MGRKMGPLQNAINDNAANLPIGSASIIKSLDSFGQSEGDGTSVVTVSVILPTYCEAANIPLITPRIHEALKQANYEHEIIVVDDNSPDDTKAICDELAINDPFYPLRLVVRRNERGLATAVVEGMRQAMGNILVVLDADLSHPPEKIPDLVALVDQGCDLAIGSRYIPGGSVDKAWPMHRRLISRTAAMLARPLTAARDPLSGFFALRKELFDAADSAGRISPMGYKIGLELLVKCECRRVEETAIHFSDRAYGQSKLTPAENINYLRHLGKLFGYKLKSLVKTTVFERREILAPLTLFVLGAVLLLAAFFKLEQLISGGVFTPGALVSAFSAWVEFGLGLWLLSGALPRVANRAAIAVFSIFGCYSLYLALNGASSCGCFGRWEIHPWWMVLLDSIALISLILTPPQPPQNNKANKLVQTPQFGFCQVFSC